MEQIKRSWYSLLGYWFELIDGYVKWFDTEGGVTDDEGSEDGDSDGDNDDDDMDDQN